MKTNNRVLKRLELDAWYGVLVARLKQNERDMVELFFEQHENKNCDEFIYIVNRMFIDKVKPKNWALIMELLTVLKQRNKGI